MARGDSLLAIAARYGVSMQSLKLHNNLRTNTVKLGQTLKIPGGSTAVASQPIARPSYTPPPSAPRQHKVVAGDTLSRIASRYGVSIGAIQRHNKMKNATVKIGQTIKIPTS